MEYNAFFMAVKVPVICFVNVKLHSYGFHPGYSQQRTLYSSLPHIQGRTVYSFRLHQLHDNLSEGIFLIHLLYTNSQKDIHRHLNTQQSNLGPARIPHSCCKESLRGSRNQKSILVLRPRQPLRQNRQKMNLSMRQ